MKNHIFLSGHCRQIKVSFHTLLLSKYLAIQKIQLIVALQYLKSVVHFKKQKLHKIVKATKKDFCR